MVEADGGRRRSAVCTVLLEYSMDGLPWVELAWPICCENGSVSWAQEKRVGGYESNARGEEVLYTGGFNCCRWGMEGYASVALVRSEEEGSQRDASVPSPI